MTDSIVQLPVGTPVTFWPGEIKGPGRKGRIRSEVWTVGGQPVVKVDGYPGGIALTHIKVRRTPAPELYFPFPDCSVCGESTGHDGDSFVCERCGLYWPDDGGEGEWYDEDVEQCPSTHQPMALNEYAAGKPWQFETIRCVLDAGHEGKHRADPITTWTDQTAVNGYGPAAEVAS